jgi:hypothetical protein
MKTKFGQRSFYLILFIIVHRQRIFKTFFFPFSIFHFNHIANNFLLERFRNNKMRDNYCRLI